MEMGILYLGGVLLSIVIAILWIALPFAVFGTKPILQSILRELKAQNELLRTLAGQARKD